MTGMKKNATTSKVKKVATKPAAAKKAKAVPAKKKTKTTTSKKKKASTTTSKKKGATRTTSKTKSKKAKAPAVKKSKATTTPKAKKVGKQQDVAVGANFRNPNVPSFAKHIPYSYLFTDEEFEMIRHYPDTYHPFFNLGERHIVGYCRKCQKPTYNDLDGCGRWEHCRDLRCFQCGWDFDIQLKGESFDWNDFAENVEEDPIKLKFIRERARTVYRNV